MWFQEIKLRILSLSLKLLIQNLMISRLRVTVFQWQHLRKYSWKLTKNLHQNCLVLVIRLAFLILGTRSINFHRWAIQKESEIPSTTQNLISIALVCSKNLVLLMMTSIWLEGATCAPLLVLIQQNDLSCTEEIGATFYALSSFLSPSSSSASTSALDHPSSSSHLPAIWARDGTLPSREFWWMI